MKSWTPVLQGREGPKYLAIAEAIAADIAAGRLAPGDRLPPQRALAGRLALDFTTVARGYVEAGKRGSGRIRRRARHFRPAARDGARRRRPAALARRLHDEHAARAGRSGAARAMREGVRERRGRSRIRCCATRASAARRWTATPPRPGSAGARSFPRRSAYSSRPARMARWSASSACWRKAGDSVLCEAITYPGRARDRAQLGLQLVGVEMDGDGVIPEALEEAIRRHAPKAIYLNPTLQNPTTITIPERRRAAICSLARRRHVPIVEDDAYGFIPTHGPPPLAAIAPDACWHIAGLAKCIGAGLRLAYVVAPDAPRRLVVQQRHARALRDGVADLGGGRDALDQRRHRRHDPALHPRGKHRARAHRREGVGAGVLSLRSAELQLLAADAQRLDALGLRQPVRGRPVLASCRATPSRRTARRPRRCASDWAAPSRARRSSAGWSSYRISSRGSLSRSRLRRGADVERAYRRFRAAWGRRHGRPRAILR